MDLPPSYSRDQQVLLHMPHFETQRIRAARRAMQNARMGRPNSAGIGLKEVGIQINSKGAVVVDDTSKTAVDNIYAIGDLTNRINLTPVALEEGMAVVETIFGARPTAVDYTKGASVQA